MIIENVPFTTIDDTPLLVKQTLDEVAKAVVSTMGPNGRLSLIEVGTSVKVTKDGVSVAKAIKMNDPRKEVISRIIVEPSIKTDMDCGDGTTTTIFMTWLFHRLLTKYTTYVERARIEKIVGLLIGALEEKTIAITLDSELLDSLALTSSNNDHALAKSVLDIYRANSDHFPAFEIKEGVSSEDKVISTDKMVLRMTMANPAFSQFGNGVETEFKDVIFVAVDNSIKPSSLDETTTIIGKLLNKVAPFVKQKFAKEIGEGRTINVVFVSRNSEHDFNTILLTLNSFTNDPNHQHYRTMNGVKFVAAQTGLGGSMGTLLMQDLCITLGGRLYNTLDQFLDVPQGEISTEVLTLGSQRSLVKLSDAGKVRTAERVVSLKEEIDSYTLGEKFSPKARTVERRIRDLSGRLITIFVGGETQSDIRERIDRFEDVVKAVKSALENGILPGVGTALIEASLGLDEWVVRDNNEISLDILEICLAQYVYLMSGATLDSPVFVNNKAGDIVTEYARIRKELGDLGGDAPPIVNLSSGQIGTAMELGVYDTAFAAITALKGGYKTAKILASASSMLLGSKLGGVSIKTS